MTTRAASLMALAALAAPSAMTSPAAAQDAPPAAMAPEVLGHADFGWTLRTLDGREVLLESYRGRPLLINFWATWCAPCLAELPSIERLAASPEASGTTFLLISPEAPGVVERFARRRGLSLPVLVEATRMPAAWGLEAVPTTWVVDAGGRIVLRHRGAAEWDTPAMRDFLGWLGDASR